MKEVAGKIQMIPSAPEQSSLETREVRDCNDKNALRPQNAVNLFQDIIGVQEMFKDVPECDDIKPRIREIRCEEITMHKRHI